MMKSITATIGLLLGATTMAATAEDEAAYPKFAKKFNRLNRPDYDWEPHTVVSEGWSLTVFRVFSTDPAVQAESKSPVVCQPGRGGGASPTGWKMQLPERGTEVWLSSQRGYANSDTNERDGEWSLKERWSYTFADKGYYDIPAIVERVKEVTGKDKVTVLGSSQGSASLYYGLAKRQDWYAENVDRAILLSSCIILNRDQP